MIEDIIKMLDDLISMTESSQQNFRKSLLEAKANYDIHQITTIKKLEEN